MLGKIQIDGVEYQINDEFKEQAATLSDTLSLDQRVSAALLLEGQGEAEALDRPAVVCAVIQFHERRTYLVDCVRLIFRIQEDFEVSNDMRAVLEEVIQSLVRNDATQQPDGPAFMRRCLSTLMDIKKWLDSVGEHVQRINALGGVSTPDVEEIMGFQQQQLTQQHEFLGALLFHLIKANYARPGDLDVLQGQLRQLEKWNNLVVHYVPALIQLTSSYNSEGIVTREEAAATYRQIVDARDQRPWPLRNVQAMATVFWMAEYNSWFIDHDANLIEGPEAQRESDGRYDALVQALRDGAFQSIISICSSCVPDDWYGPARKELIRSLLGDTPLLPPEPAPISPYFRTMLMEEFETFVYSFIENMPETLRRFKLEEEDQRRRILASFQPGLQDDVEQQDRHLERFFIIMSYAYENRPSAALPFWENPDGNLYGFLQWFSGRVSTPLIGAFCDMFRSLSHGEDCAAAAHTFLLETSAPSSRVRRATCLSWSQIFDELEFYSSKIRETPGVPAAASTSYQAKSRMVASDEPETPIMLECYLQLTGHLCRQSATVRSWMLAHPTFRLMDTAFLLCHATVPARVRACAFGCVEALLINKTGELSDAAWVALDQWASVGFAQGMQIHRPARSIVGQSNWAEEVAFEAVSNNPDESIAFVSLLQQSMAMPSDADPSNGTLPFPEQLGSSYRMPGIEPYVDMVMGKIFSSKLLPVDGVTPSFALAARTLHFVETCLDTFNESLLILTYRTKQSFDDCLSTSSLASYVRLHPFARMIEWMFNETVAGVLFRIAHEDINEVALAANDSPRMKALTSSINVMSLVTDLQSTFLDIVRPMVKSQPGGRSQTVISPAIASFEDCLSLNLRIVADVAFYCGSGDADLALASIELLKRFSESRKLNHLQRPLNGSRISVNKLVGVLQRNKDVEPVARSLIQILDINEREILRGPGTSDFNMKYAILDFLESTLAAHPDQPSLAHALLGFDCSGHTIDVPQNGLFAKRSSLFHAALNLSLAYPETGVGDNFLYWCVSLKSKAAHIVRLLWSSPLTSANILADMRIGGYFFADWLQTTLVNPGTLWEGLDSRDPELPFKDGTPTLDRFLALRTTLLTFTATELRSIAGSSFTTLNAEMVATLLGRTLTDEGEVIHSTIFDMLDFLEVDPLHLTLALQLDLLDGVDLECCVDSDAGIKRYNMKLVQQLLALQNHRLRALGLIKDEATDEKFLLEVQDVCAWMNGLNNLESLGRTRLETLEAWSKLVTLVLKNESISKADRTALILRFLQLISPKMEVYAYSMRPEGLVFARLVQTLFAQLELLPQDLHDERAAEVAQVRLFQLSKLCLRAITNPEAEPAMRGAFYNICYHYLTRFIRGPGARSETLNAIQAVGNGLIDTTSDDAYGGAGAIRVAAAFLLAAMAETAADCASPYMLESLVRNNFMIVLIDTIREIPTDLTNADHQGTSVPQGLESH